MIKNILSVVVLMFLLSGCGEDLQDNNPAFIGQKNNVYWAADSKGYDYFQAPSPTIVVNGSVSSGEKVTLTLVYNGTCQNDPVSTLPQGTTCYSFEQGSGNTAVFEDGAGNIYTTDHQEGEGQVTITEVGGGQLTGTFRFMAFLPDAEPGETEELGETEKSVTFHEGVFYRVPLGTWK